MAVVEWTLQLDPDSSWSDQHEEEMENRLSEIEPKWDMGVTLSHDRPRRVFATDIEALQTLANILDTIKKHDPHLHARLHFIKRSYCMCCPDDVLEGPTTIDQALRKYL